MSNTAYDYARFKSPEEKFDYDLHVVGKPHKKQAPLRLIKIYNALLCVAIAMMSASIIFGYSKVSVLTNKEADLEEYLAQVESENISLNARIENMFNLAYVESFAKENLDMINVDENQIEQIYIKKPDMVDSVNKSSIFNIFK